MKNKRLEKMIYKLMALLVILQTFAPVIALAETVDQKASGVTITKATVAKHEEEVSLELQGQVAENTQTVEKQVTLSGGVAFLPVATQALGVGSATFSAQATALKLVLPAGTKGTFALSVKLDPTTVSNAFVVQLDQQKLPVNLPVSTVESTVASSTEESSATEATTITTETTESTESSTEASSETEASTSEATTETTASSSETAPEKESDIEKAESGNDIRDYFPNGEGTIIDSADATYYDRDGNQLEPPVPADAEVRIHYEWSIPEEVREQIKPGDQFTFNLPEGVKPKAGQTGELKGPDGTVYATYTMDENGQVVITFNENVTDEIDISGSFDFSTEFDTTHIDGPGEHEITFPTEDNLPPIGVEVKPATDTAIAKSGHFDRTPNPTEVTWEVDFNQGMNELTDPTITENWPQGLTYESVKVYELVMNLDGTVEKVGRELSSDEYTVDANGNVTIKGETNAAYRIEYVTSIDEDAIPEEGGDVTFNNQATLTDKDNTEGLDAEASVSNTFGKMLEKNQVGYDPDNQEFTWEIKYNYGEKEIDQDDAVITDSMSSNMALSEDPVIYPITFGPNGEEIQGNTPLKEGEDYKLVKNPNGDGFVIEFLHDIDSAYKVVYKTKVDGTVTDPTDVTNKVEVDTGETDEDNGTAEQQNVIKNLDSNSIDYQNKTVDWVIQVNKNHYEMHDLVLTDHFSPVPGLQLVQNPERDGYKMTVTSSSGVELVQGVDYTVVPTLDAQSQQTGFELKFIGKYNPTNEAFTVKYTTYFDAKLLDPNQPNGGHFTNNVEADWTSENGDHHHSEDEDDFEPNPDYALNAQKSGSYNAQTKTIKWQIAVNLSGQLLEQAFLTDPIKDNQRYVAGTLKVYEAHTDPSGVVVKDDEEPDNDRMVSVTEPAVNNKQTIDIRFPDLSQHTYLIEFETSLVGQVIEASGEYDNHATYSNDGEDRDVVGEVSVNNGGNHMQKSGEQDESDPNYVNWHIMINAAQSVLNNVVVTDKPSNNQIVDQDSIKLYGTTVAVDGTVTPDKSVVLTEGVDYTLELTTDNITGDQVLTVSFLHEIDQAYYMEYRALINSSSTGQNDTVTNEASITGEGTKTVTDESGEDIEVEIDHSGGSASGTKGLITLQKTAGDQSTILTGAHFQLWNLEKTQILREGDVDANGQITFGNLKMGDYLLVETVAPDGYTIPDDLVQGRKISVTKETTVEGASPTNIVNTPNRVVLTKSGEHKEKLANAEFRLEQQLGDLWVPVSTGQLITDAQGQLVIESLPLGHYRLIETKAPAGYLINTQPIEFTVSKNDQNQIPEINLEMIDYRGKASLIKEDQEGNPLAGAVFKVVDSQGKTVQADLVADDKGQVNVSDLAPGDYFFVETKAPDGFVLNTTTYPFTIAEAATDQPVVIEAGTAINYQGAASLLKEDEAGNSLAGAIFKVIDENGQTVQSNLVSDESGKVTVSGLAPGKYQFVETKAPDGYILNTEKIDFTIEAQSEGEPVTVTAGSLTNYQGAVKIRKVDTQHESLAGAEFTLYDKDQNVLATAVSEADGWMEFEDLAPGTYFLVETKAPSLPDGTDYVINPYPIRVVIPDKTAGKPAVIDLGEFQNFKGKAEIQKVGEKGSIAGAKFNLYRLVDGQEKLLQEVTVPESGILPLENLGAGQYKLVETTAAPGYIINSQPIYFVVDPDFSGEIDHLDFENYQAEIIAQKVDGDGLVENGLAGAEFQIYEQDQNGNQGQGPIAFTDRKGNEQDTLTSDQTGKLYAAGLSIGKYLLVETKAPTGYVLNSQPRPFEITEQLGKPETIDLGEIVNYRGKLDITKSNDQEKLLEGGTFVLGKDPEGKQPVTVIDEAGKETTELHAVNGHIKAQGIQPGTYYLVETEAPEGFIVNTEAIKIVIPDEVDGQSDLLVTGNLVNYQGAAELIKVDQDQNPLAKAEFKVVDQAGKTVRTGLVSNQKGQIKVDQLAPGTYAFVEVKAPNGYQLSEEVRNFTIPEKAAGKPVLVEMQAFVNKLKPDEKQPVKTKPLFPKTGEKHNSLLFLSGLIILAGAVWLIWKRRSQQNHSDTK
ncbi:SpaA isopeptide-forming pilin-related protein [Enterococcus diestrammenae]|uniref:SpaA isopeptide-forming pilin-related protein n=1 Tax=Enterococcus diestrammenae TaxID=1155073 RepID=UPI00195CBA95